MKRLLLSLSMTFALIAAPDVRAAFLSIDDTSPAETITISANDFEGGLSVNGVLVQSGLASPAAVTIPETGPIAILASWIAPGVTGSFSRTIILVEPSDATLISDIWDFTVEFDGSFAHLNGIFISDTEGSLGHLTGTENPGDVFKEGGDVPFSAAFLEGHLNSDVERVPEPATLAILGLGLAGLGFMRRRRIA